MSGSPEKLSRGLKQRHLTMIAIGGVIGAGLFVGSGVVISNTGPGAFLGYALTGVLIVLVMRMLGEMAAANPSTGSFADYARHALGGWAGFSVGWLYWYFWVIVVGFEAVAGAKILTYWIDAPLWLLSLGLMVLMTATNLFSVSSFGEFEFWFAGIKVFAIIAFLGLGTLFVIGLWPNKGMDFSNLTANGGFFPLGVGAIFSSIVVVIFSMVGAEIATIAAAESEDPARAVVRATNSVVARISIFFVGSVFLLAVILPWNSTQLSASPYVSAFDAMGIPYAATIMNAVVLTAVLSCLNSGLYTASRMLFVLAGRREAPAGLVKLSRRGVPMAAILTSTVVGFLCVVAAAISPNGVFLFLLNSSGAVILFVYLLIALSQLVLRRRVAAEQLKVKMWFYPWLTLLTIAGIVAVLVLMYLDTSSREQLLLSLLAWAVFIGLYLITKWRGGSIDAAGVSDAAAEGSGRSTTRVLVLANETMGADELLGELRDVDEKDAVEYFLCVPAPAETGQDGGDGARTAWEANVRAARTRLDATLDTLHAQGFAAQGQLVDSPPFQAVQAAAASFHPDQIVISTLPESRSRWLGEDLIGQARSTSDVPVRHVVSTIPPAPVTAP